jgi:hypothetical protein
MAGRDYQAIRAERPSARVFSLTTSCNARRQLVAAFQSKAAGLMPIAAESDIIGGGHMKALLESTLPEGSVSRAPG